MDSKTREGAELTRYLLGEVSEHERARLEEAYFADDGTFEQMLIAEEELIDAYARGELSAAERTQFEKVFLGSPRGRERVGFARTLADAVSDARPDAAVSASAADVTRASRPSFFAALRTRRSALRLAFAASVVVAVVGFTWLLVERARMRDELRRLSDERAALQQGAQELERRVAAEQKRSEDLLSQLEGEREQPTQGGQQKDETVSQERPPRDEQQTGRPVRENKAVIARRTPRRESVRDPATTNTTDATLGSNPRRIDSLPPRDRTVAALTGSVSFNLSPGQVRGGGANTIAVPRKATYLLLQLKLERDSAHESYGAVIETAEGKQVWSADSIKPRRAADAGAVVELPAVPARNLPPNDYVLLLSGKRPDGNSEGVADYSFKVVRK